MRTHDGDREPNRVERNVVLSHELEIGHVLRRIAEPPAAPGIALVVPFRPLPGSADVFDRRIKPDIEHFALQFAVANVIRHRHAPFDITRDAAIVQAFVQPLVRNRGDQDRPILLACNPFPELRDELRLLQEQMGRITNFDVR